METIILFLLFFFSDPTFPMSPRERMAQDCWNTYWKEVAAANKRYSDNPQDPNRQATKDAQMYQAKKNRYDCLKSKGFRGDFPEPRPRRRLADIEENDFEKPDEE